ncbi:MAG: hypothetical protein OER21_13605 [Gemmatimonadota bacterium]|nr:hypothetical protein [Gemmatimonadota bacterium]
MIEHLLAHLARNPALRTEPSTVERVILHALYWVCFGLVLRVALAALDIGPAISTGALGYLLGLAAACGVFLFWAAMQRQPPPAMWFVSHLAWLTMSCALLGLAFAGGLILVIAVVMLVAVFPVLAFLVYTPIALGVTVGLWFVYRIVWGYRALLDGSAVGRIGGSTEGRSDGRTGGRTDTLERRPISRPSLHPPAHLRG